MTTAPLRSASLPRLDGLDVARGLAFVGMVLVNYGVVMAMGGRDPAWVKALRDAFTGRAAALFVLLAGAGLSLMVSRAAQRDPARGIAGARRIYAQRALALLIGGYAFYPFWEGDILHYYGVYLALGALLAPLRSRWLLCVAALCVGAFVAIYHWWIPYRVVDVFMPKFWTWDGQIRNLFYNGWHPLFPWFAFFSTGMVVGRLSLGRVSVQASLLIVGLILAVCAGYGSESVIEQLQDSDLPRYRSKPWTQLLTTSCLPPGPLYVLAAVGSSLAVIGVSLMSTRLPRAVWTPLARVGRMALTLYVAHVVLGLGLWETSGGKEGRGNLQEVFWWWLATVAASMVFATLWLHRLRRGPLEYVLRKICG